MFLHSLKFLNFQLSFPSLQSKRNLYAGILTHTCDNLSFRMEKTAKSVVACEIFYCAPNELLHLRVGIYHLCESLHYHLNHHKKIKHKLNCIWFILFSIASHSTQNVQTAL